ncbi:MAG: hypothetical protein Q8L41_14410 [Anaerolineales bacterium]|nr:hypothetical protein [Anaerolineales bacterium]
MLKDIIKKLLSMILFRPLPLPSNEEKFFLSELQTKFYELPALETINVLPSEAAWLSNMNRLRELVLNQNPREFLRWDVVSKTMFVSFAPYTAKELKYLKQRPDWNTRWYTAIKESTVGHPVPYIFFPASSGNLIHQAYHIAKFEEQTNVEVHNVDYVFEFGGGYGCMCRLFYNLGFQGRYIIFDLPSFSALQVYFLKTLGLPVQSLTEFVKSRTGIVCVYDIDQLTTLLADHIDARNTMFVATWSISESPITLRGLILPLISGFQSFLIAYQDIFGEVDNVDFFDNWKEAVRNVAWHSWRIEHIPGNNYLVGSVPRLTGID